MRIILTILTTVMTIIPVMAHKYSFGFNNTPISDALLKIGKEHPDINISFIHKELDNYHTSAKIDTDDAYEALRQTIGLNPVSVIKSGDHYYIEAFQHGKFRYTGKTMGKDNRPVEAATVMLLEPNDSTVLTYGITDEEGRFSIPCDKQEVIAKFTCLGYKPTFLKCESFKLGTVVMEELPIRLKTVKVESDNASLYCDKSIYRPAQRQKNASQTATDLLVRMAIPQLNARLGSSNVTTSSGQPVAMYIDYVPASDHDLRMMRMSDVKSVEYYEYPSDPRFQGNRHVVNFRMVKYEYGGYVKTFANENFIANSGFMQANGRFVKGKMTYDIMGYAYYMANNHFSTDQTETFRLPQENGTIKSFQRESTTESSKYRKQNYETSVRALYADEKITANSQVSVGLDNIPHNDNRGIVEYTDKTLLPSQYDMSAFSKAKYITYSGYYYFVLPNNSSLTASLKYSYSHTNQDSKYTESSIIPIANSANDHTHEGSAYLYYNKKFSDRNSFNLHARTIYEHNKTSYHGSVNELDRSTTRDYQVGASYTYKNKRLTASTGFGWDWIKTTLNANRSFSNFPYLDVSVNYSPNKKNSFGIVFHYSVWLPSSNYKSENVIHISPFLWHTGNPLLKSHRCYDIWGNYTFIPSNKFNMSAFAGSWLVGNRPAFVYEATPDGIIRNIRQPMGSFRHYNYGINVSTNQFDGNLYLSGQVEHLYVHNGQPYNIDHSKISYYVQALYYLGSFNFAIAYQSAKATDNFDCMSGVWTSSKDNFTIQTGWSNSSWNVIFSARNLQRWNWKSTHEVMKSEYYSVNKWVSNASSHALIQLSATYTFGFGKKVNKENEISKQGGASSGILK